MRKGIKSNKFTHKLKLKKWRKKKAEMNMNIVEEIWRGCIK
jgi:hypothetical protein